MLIFKFIPSIIKDEGRLIKELPFVTNQTLQEYLSETGFDIQGTRFILSGKVVDDLSIVLQDGDEVIVTSDVQWPALVAIGAWLWQWGALIMAVLSVAYSIYAFCTQPRAPTFDTSGDGLDEGSPTYGWDGITNTQDVGVPIPIVYGEHRVGGNIINQFIRTDGDKEYLNLLIALSEGEIENISNVKINENPSANFEGIILNSRYGTNSQTQIPNFNDSHDLKALDANLVKDDPYIYTTVNEDITAFELKLTLQGGLFQINESSGNVESWDVIHKVEYKLHADGAYTDLGSTTISGKSRTDLRRVFRKEGLTAGQYDIKITRTSDDSSLDPMKQGDLYLKGVDEIAQNEPLIYPNVALLGVEALATDQLSGSTPTITSLIKGRKVSVPDIRESAGGSTVPWEDYYYDPNDAHYKGLSDNRELYFDGSTFINAYSANPIWCLRDLITNTRYGLGDYITASLLDTAQLLEMAQYCDEIVDDGLGGDERRFRLDVVIDSSTKALDLISQLGATFRCFVFYSNGAVKLKIDKAESPVQMFGMGNIISESFVQSWKSVKEIPNVVEIQFLNEALDYKNDLISVLDEVSLSAGNPIRKKPLRLFCTHLTQALREGKFALNLGKYLNRTITLRAGIDAIACQAGDVINVSHDVPQWGFSGRVKIGSTTTKVYLDQAVTVEAGKTYKLRIRFADDTQEEKTVSSGEGTYTEIEVIGNAFSQAPANYDLYSFGEINKVVAPYRIVSMKRAENSEVEITALEYNDDIYDTDTITLPDNNYSALSTTIPLVTDLALTQNPAGTQIDVWFRKPDSSTYQNKYSFAKIYLSDNAGASYNLVGQTYGQDYSIVGSYTDGATYRVKVLTVCTNGLEDKLSNAPAEDIVMDVGGTVVETPADVTGFAYTWGDLLLLTWYTNTELSLAGYEIRDENANWGTDDEHLIYKGLANRYTMQPATRTVGTFYIKAYNTAGEYSDASANITPANSAPSAPASLTANVIWDTATLSWVDVADADIKYYEVLKSETNAWAGEEAVIARVSGKSLNVKARYSRSGQADSATDTTIVDESLSGLGDDYLIGDLITITAGTGLGQTRTITDFDDASGTITVDTEWDTNPDTTSKFMLADVAYFKVRGVDAYGVGTLSTAVTAEFSAFTEDAFGDNVISARKIYVACLSALSANMGTITAGLIQGGTIQTGASGARTVFSSSELRSYDASNCVMFEVSNGCVIARTLRLEDPTNACCYSYLSAGQWYFHNELNVATPYVKRLCSGEAGTGCTVDLCSWTCEPKVMVGIKQLRSYDSSFAVSCQLWCVYYDCMCQYCLCAECYGYCFIVHAKLVKSAGVYAECIPDVAEACSIFTHSDACCSLIRSKFNYWCFCNTSSNCYGYGIHCYRLKFKCCVGGCAWTCCDYSYCQPHSTIGELKDCSYVCQTLCFGSAGCWEIQLIDVSTTWCLSTISGVTTALCCRALDTVSVCTVLTCCCGTCTCCCYGSYNVGGSAPTNVYCSYFCVCWCGSIGICMNRDDGTLVGDSCACMCIYTTALATYRNCCTWTGSNWYCCVCTWTSTAFCCDVSAFNACAFTSVCLMAWLYMCTREHYGCAFACNLGGVLYQCYCSLPANATCSYAHLYGNTDYASAEVVLDPAGTLNYLAIGY